MLTDLNYDKNEPRQPREKITIGKALYAMLRLIPIIVLVVSQLIDGIGKVLIQSLIANGWDAQMLQPLGMLLALPVIFLFEMAIDLILFGMKRLTKAQQLDWFIMVSFLRDVSKNEVEKRNWPRAYI